MLTVGVKNFFNNLERIRRSTNKTLQYKNVLACNTIDITVFIGTRSIANQIAWFWENGTMLNDSRYPLSDQSVCQQMSLPLTYDDGINLLPKSCDQDEAYFICSIPGTSNLQLFYLLSIVV